MENNGCVWMKIHVDGHQSRLAGGLDHVFIFHNIWDVNLPSDFHIFQRGRYNHQPAGKNREQTNFNERIPGLG